MVQLYVANLGSHTRFWAFLKSIDHTLTRILADEASSELSELDKDRLLALVEFLKGIESTGVDITDVTAPQKMLVPGNSTRPNFSFSRDLRTKINKHENFQKYLPSSKMSINGKLEKLREAIENYVKSGSQLFGKNAPKSEFAVLQSILRSLLEDVELLRTH